MPSLLPANPIFCALDRPDLDATLALARTLVDTVGGFKLGLEFFTANGPRGVAAVAALGLPIFLDLKFHDIPNTVAGAVRSARTLPVAMLTLHASGGRAMLEAAAAARGDGGPWLLAVTLLTSLDEIDLRLLGVTRAPGEQVAALAEIALAAGCDGLVCSPHEIESLRRRFGRAPKLVVPGIREGDAADDQKRTLDARTARALGADILVVGRPITAAADPGAAAARILASLGGSAVA